MHINDFYDDIAYHEKKPAIKVILETDFTKEIRILMDTDQEMKEHRTPYPIVIQVVEGQIDFGVNGERHDLKKGSILALSGDVPHDLKARERSMVRLTLNKSDFTDRVKEVANQ